MSCRESWHDEGVDDSIRRLFDALTSIESKKEVHKGVGKASSHARWGRKDAEEVRKEERVPGGVMRAAHWKPEGVRSRSLPLSLKFPSFFNRTFSLFSFLVSFGGSFPFPPADPLLNGP